ncbi:hypothetical protein LCGC14_2385130, partial [marine sediment metagenome]
DYCVAPNQKWLDGFVVENGKIKQFVATPLGSGASAEEQITGKAEFGGLQIEVFPMKLEAFERRFPKGPYPGGSCGLGLAGGYGPPGVYTSTLINDGSASVVPESCLVASNEALERSDDSGPPKKGIETWSGRPGGSRKRSRKQKAPVQDMAMGAGGSMVQQVFEDPYNIEDWDLEHGSRCFVHLCSSTAWRQVTGFEPPTVPLTPAEYVAHNVPWFHLWDDEAKALKGTKKLAGLKTVKQVGEEKGVPLVTEDMSVVPEHVIPLSKDAVREGEW